MLTQRLLKMSWPIMLGYASHLLTGLIDSLMVGRLGTEHLAAAALSNQVFYISLVFLNGLALGITPVVTQARVLNQQNILKRLFSSSIALWLILAPVIVIGTMFTADNLNYLTPEQNLADLGGRYLRWLGLSLLPLVFFLVLKQYCEGLGMIWQPMVVAFIGNGINILLNYILIYGIVGFIQPQELTGAGIATFLSRFSMGIILLGWMIISPIFRANLSFNFRKPFSKKCTVRIIRTGAPMGVYGILAAGIFSVAGVLIGWLDAESMAAHQIIMSITILSWISAAGIGSAATIIAAELRTLRNLPTLKNLNITAQLSTLVFMGVVSVSIITFHKEIPFFFTISPKVAEITSGLLLIAAIFSLADGSQAATMGTLRGLEDAMLPAGIAIGWYWFAGLPLVYFGGIYYFQSVEAVWWAFCIIMYGLAISLQIRVLTQIQSKLQTKNLEVLRVSNSIGNAL